MVLIVAVPVPDKDISSIYCHTDCDVTKEAIRDPVSVLCPTCPCCNAVMCLCHLSSEYSPLRFQGTVRLVSISKQGD